MPAMPGKLYTEFVRNLKPTVVEPTELLFSRNRADSVDQDVARADRQKDYAAYRCMKYKNLEGRWQDKFSLVKDWLILALQMSAA